MVVDPTQISRAKLAGAAGVTLRYGLNPKETTKALIDVAFGLGMEPVVQVKSGFSDVRSSRSVGSMHSAINQLTHPPTHPTLPTNERQVKTAEEAKEAVAMGAQLLFLVGNTRAQAVELRPSLPSDAEPVMVGYDLRRPKEFQYGLNEVEDAWVVRDHSFHAVYVSNLLFQTPLDDVVGPSAVIRALRAKACHFMVDPLDWIEKAVTEGTKETLGELMA